MIGIHDPWTGEAELRELASALEANWLSTGGEKVAVLEGQLKAFFGSPAALATINGSAALVLALRVSGVCPGDHVLVSEYGFVATANAVRQLGAEPIFLGPSSEEEPFVSLASIQAFLDSEVDAGNRYRATGRAVRGLLYNSPFGFSCPQLAEAVSLFERRGLFLIEDASQSLGVKVGGRYLGTVGQLGVFSFNGNKTVAMGSGGALLGRNAAQVSHASHLSRQARSDPFDFFYDEQAYNFSCSNLSAAVGVAQLRRLPEMLSRKVALRREYASLLAGGGWGLAGPAEEFPAWLNVVLAPRPLSRRELAAVAGTMEASGVRVRPVFPAVTRNRFYEGSPRFGSARGDVFFARGLCLPSGAGLTREELARVAEALREASRRHGIA